MLLTSLRALLQFTTVLPLGATADFSLFAKRSYLYPLAGYVTGGIAGLCAFWIADPLIAAAVAVTALLIVTGANHFDGLMDLGDGLMAHGSREIRVRALTDRQIGTGGFAAGAAVLLLTFAALTGIRDLLWALVIAEVAGMFSMAVLTVYGEPFREGLHAALHGQAKGWFPLAAALLCTPLLLFPVDPYSLVAAALLAILSPAVLLLISRHLFGGVNGDVVGASHELTRAFVLCAMVLVPMSALF
jgi:adenosylcobinamide-GDP ribazoletransferase